MGAVAVPAAMAKYLLNEDVIPCRHGTCFLTKYQQLPKWAGAWHTLYLLPSWDVYDAVFKAFSGESDFHVHSMEQAVTVVEELMNDKLGWINHTLFEEWSCALRTARWYFMDPNETVDDEETRQSMLEETDRYLQDYGKLIVHPIPANLLEVTEQDGVLFDAHKKRILSVNAEQFNSSKYHVPDSVECIDAYAFKQIEVLRQIDLNRVRKIGAAAFTQSGLETATIPSTVKTIGEYAFAACRTLKSVVFENEMEYLANNMFAGCYALTDVQLPQNLVGLERGVFAYADSLKTLELPNSLRYIGQNCFFDSGLSLIEIPASVLDLEKSCFKGCNLEIKYGTNRKPTLL